MESMHPALDPELLAAFRRATEIDQSLGPVGPGLEDLRARSALARRYWNEGGPEMVDVSERVIPGPTRDVPVVVYRARELRGPAPVFLFLHGGGFQIGNQWANDRQMREIAAAWGGIVISADYPHVPEYVFPAPVLEVAAVLRWLHGAGGEWGLDTERVAVGGVSAGACVGFGAAASLGRPAWLRAAVGIVGAFSFDTTTSSMRQFGDGTLYPPASAIQPMLQAYVPDPAARTDPLAVPMLADACVFPPTFIAAAEYDVFRDASALMAARLAQSGILHFFKIYPGMAHLFFGYSREVPTAAECVADVAGFLAERLPLRPSQGLCSMRVT